MRELGKITKDMELGFRCFQTGHYTPVNGTRARLMELEG